METFVTYAMITVVLAMVSFVLWSAILKIPRKEIFGFQFFNWDDQDRNPDIFESMVVHFGCSIFIVGILAASGIMHI